MAKKFYGGIDLQTNSKLRFIESSGANFVSLRSPASLSADLDLRLPATDLANGAMVSDGSGNLSLALLVNANISASAAIAYSKLALTGAIVNADIATGVDAAKIADGSVSNTEFQYISTLSSNAQDQLDAKVAKAGDTMTGALILDNESPVHFREATGNGTHSVSFKAPASLAGNTPYVLPTAYPAANNYRLVSTTGGTLSWSAPAAAASFKDTWATADTATKAITHSLASTDVIVQIFDIATGAGIEVDSVVRTDANTVTVTASEAPPAGSWRVLILPV